MRKVGELFGGGSSPKKESQETRITETKNFDTPLLEPENEPDSSPQTKKAIELTEAAIEHNRLKEEEEFEIYNKDQVALSLCRFQVQELQSDIEVVRAFMKNKITFEEFNKDYENYLKHPNLLMKIHGELYNPGVGIPQIISLLAFKQVLHLKMPKKTKPQALEEQVVAVEDSNEEGAEEDITTPPPSPKERIPDKK